MALFRRLAALGAAAEAARRYAQKNPDKLRELTDKAAAFADQRTKGKYTNQITTAKRKVAEVTGVGPASPTTYPGQHRPTPFKRDS
ncbi:MAG: antitoxin [Pseudonocardiales bacterium]|nr:antitoxin [Pseudonocardiales bacterium]